MILEDNYYLPEVVCENLIKLQKFYGGNYYHINKTWSVEVSSMMIKHIKELKNIIFDIEKKHNFLKEAKLVNTQIVRWPEGSYHVEHLDERDKEVDKWAFFLYLNNNFKGGELIVEDAVIKPDIGKLVIFKAGIMKHKVNKILKGERFTLAGWYI